MGGCELIPDNNVTDLGVIVWTDLSWSAHINVIAKEARQRAAWALSIFKNRHPDCMLTLLKSIIRSKVEYNSPLWHSSKLADIRTIESIQRSFTKKIDGMGSLDYWQRRLRQLKLMSLQRRRERYILFHVWKTAYHKTPNSLNIEFFYDDLREALKIKLKPLPRTGSRQINLYEQCFSVFGAKIWNLLPAHITLKDTFESFKFALDKFLLTLPDRPPLIGYPYSHNNSLLYVISSRLLQPEM